MSKKNDDFFKVKKTWSKVKDQLLGCYFKPYVQKIIHTNKPLVYVDCFAGKGKFDDGNSGSPLIALEIIEECKKSTIKTHTDIRASFIDLNYADNLQSNLTNYDVEIIPGRYEDNILEILQKSIDCNVFLYIDPYGIKALHSSLFDRFADAPFYSIELLLNLNSFGFIREACHVMNVQLNLDDPTLFADLVEYDSTELPANEESIQELNEIAGGDYWQPIIQDYKARRIDGYMAEERFAEKYCQRLSQKYEFVLNMPLRIKPGQRPKYRMIHATNHPDGCLLMVDNICKRWEVWQNHQSAGQISMFDEDVNNQIIDKDDIRKKVIEHYKQFSMSASLNKTLAQFFTEYGIICKKKDVIEILKDFENKSYISVIRNPERTSTGKPSKFMEEKNNQTVQLRWAR